MRPSVQSSHGVHHALLPIAVVAALIGLLPASASAQFGYPAPYPYYYGGAYARYESDLRVNVKPSGASVFVDGYFAGQVDDFDGVFQRLHLESGQHEIVVYLQGHRSIRERLYFSPNATRKLSGTLEPLPAGEPDEGPPVPQPNITNGPDPRNPGGMPPGAGPQARRGPPPPPDRGGPPRPPDRGPGPTGQNRQNPPPQSFVGTLSIRVQPDGADVLIDGERWNTGPDSERLLVQLSEGRHMVEVNKPGYRRFSTEIQLRAGETVPLNVSLAPDR